MDVLFTYPHANSSFPPSDHPNSTQNHLKVCNSFPKSFACETLRAINCKLMSESLKRSTFWRATGVPELAQSVPDTEVACVTRCVTRKVARSKSAVNYVTRAVLRIRKRCTTKVTRPITLI